MASRSRRGCARPPPAGRGAARGRTPWEARSRRRAPAPPARSVACPPSPSAFRRLVLLQPCDRDADVHEGTEHDDLITLACAAEGGLERRRRRLELENGRFEVPRELVVGRRARPAEGRE